MNHYYKPFFADTVKMALAIKYLLLAVTFSLLVSCGGEKSQPTTKRPFLTATIKDALKLDTMGIFYKNFLEAYGMQEFNDKKLAVHSEWNLADTVLYRLLDLEKNDPDSFNVKYGGIDSVWVSDYKPDSTLFIPQIIGQLIKLEEGFEKYHLKGVTSQKALDGFLDEIYILRKMEGFDNEKEKIFRPVGEVHLIVRGDKERMDDWDDRVDFYRAEPMLRKYFGDKMNEAKHFSQIKTNWESVGIVVNSSSFELNGTEIVLKTKLLKDLSFSDWWNMSFCKNERFANDPSMNIDEGTVYGTCVFIGDDLIYTNAHVVFYPFDSNSQGLVEGLRFIKNFQNSSYVNGSQNEVRINSGCIFEVDDNILDEVKNEWDNIACATCNDWAIVPVRNVNRSSNKCRNEPLLMSDENPVPISKIYSIGHPLGLSKKFVFDGEVQKDEDEKNKAFFVLLDIVGGTSGSPLFDAVTHDLVGVVNGAAYAKEFEVDTVGGCLSIKEVLPNSTTFEGQIAQKITNFKSK